MQAFKSQLPHNDRLFSKVAAAATANSNNHNYFLCNYLFSEDYYLNSVLGKDEESLSNGSVSVLVSQLGRQTDVA